MLRIGLFLLTNLAVMVVFGIVMNVIAPMLGFNLGGTGTTSLLVMCFIYGMIGSFVSLLMSKWLAKRSTGTQVIEQPATQLEVWLVETVRRLAQNVNIDMPEVGIFDNPSPNAFATGWNKNKALVAVSTGLLQTMNKEEVEAVLAHEIGHVANGDMVTLALVQGVVNSFVMFFARIVGLFVDQAVFKNDSNSPGMGYYITSMVLDIVFGIAAQAVVMWFSRYREYRADEAGARLAGKYNMIAALEALKPASQHPDYMPQGMKAFAINEGKGGFSFSQLFASHPSLDDRIAHLQKLAN